MTSVMVFFIIVAATVFSYPFNFFGGPDLIADLKGGVEEGYGRAREMLKPNPYPADKSLGNFLSVLIGQNETMLTCPAFGRLQERKSLIKKNDLKLMTRL